MISRLMDYIETDEDIWLVYQPGGKNLGHRLCNIKTEERGNGERVFSLEHSIFYERLNSDITILADLVYNCAKILDCLSSKNLVHSDMKPDNILI